MKTRMAVRAEYEGKMAPKGDGETAQALELALKEVLGHIRAAKYVPQLLDDVSSWRGRKC